MLLYDGPASAVTRDGVVAVKTSYAKEPHDIVKEARLLAALLHPNVIPLLSRDGPLSITMPYIPYALDDLLRSSRFSPHPIISFGTPSATREVRFTILAKSIIFQILSGITYLHSAHIQIAHRDIKPSNVLLTPSARAQLIDFGIAFPVGEDAAAKAKDAWPEYPGRMYFEVSTGPYRAPELLFGPRTYDPFAIDAWSLGATFAEFFTPLRLGTNDDHDDDDDDDDEVTDLSHAPFVIPRNTGSLISSGRWTRESLFDASRGEIGLACSIFKVRGTPNEASWPSFSTLPDAGKLSFVDVNAAELRSLLPNLPPSESSADSGTQDTMIPSALDLVRRFLVYEPAWRLRPSDALQHPWFNRAEPGGLVLPADIDDGVAVDALPTTEVSRATTLTLEGKTCTLGDLLQRYVATKQ